MRHILYLEDDPQFGDVTSGILKKEGFSVDWQRDPIAGLEKFRAGQYDLCILDIMMPGLDGYTFLKTIRGINTEIPVIILSGRTLTEDIVRGFELGSDDYIRKPFSIEELAARINRLLSRRGGQATGSLSVGQYGYVPERMELTFAGRVQELTPRANDLLYRLVTNKDHFLPKKETLIELWGDDSFFNSRTLDVFISKLRRNLEQDARIRIVNIRGMGYKLIMPDVS